MRAGQITSEPAGASYKDPWVREIITLPGLGSARYGVRVEIGSRVGEDEPSALIILSEIPDNPGPEISEAFALVVSEFRQSRAALANIPGQDLTCVQHRSRDYYEVDSADLDDAGVILDAAAEDFILVLLDWQEERATNPGWVRIATPEAYLLEVIQSLRVGYGLPIWRPAYGP